MKKTSDKAVFCKPNLGKGLDDVSQFVLNFGRVEISKKAIVSCNSYYRTSRKLYKT